MKYYTIPDRKSVYECNVYVFSINSRIIILTEIVEDFKLLINIEIHFVVKIFTKPIRNNVFKGRGTLIKQVKVNKK